MCRGEDGDGLRGSDYPGRCNGGTDASIYNKKGIQTVIIGTGVKAEHTVEENIAVADMEKAVGVIQHVFKELSEKG